MVSREDSFLYTLTKKFESYCFISTIHTIQIYNILPERKQKCRGEKVMSGKGILFKGQKMRSGKDSFLYTLTKKSATHRLIMDMQNRMIGENKKVLPNL